MTASNHATLHDAEPFGRCAAARRLPALHGLPADPVNPQAIVIRVMSRDAAHHERAKRKLPTAVTQL